MSSSAFNQLEVLRVYLTRITADLDRTVDFWLKYSHDAEYGGFYNCLSADGRVFDTTKYGWLQGRQVWMYTQLYLKVDRFHKKKELLQAAVSGGDFLLTHFKNASTSKVYFSTTRDGRAIKLQRTIYAEVFFCLAMAGLFLATREKKYKTEAASMFHQILHWVRVDDSGLGRPSLPGQPDVQTLAKPMCVLDLVHAFDEVLGVGDGDDDKTSKDDDDEELNLDLQEIRAWAVDRILLHVQRGGKRILDNVRPDGKELEGAEGRLMMPGHALECGWYLLEESRRVGDADRRKTLERIAIDSFIRGPLEYGWDDKDHGGGLFYMQDVDGLPCTQLEWDMKLWWPHTEAMVACLEAFRYTRQQEHLESFRKVADYASHHFVDETGGEWFGYCNRRGEVSSRFKGGPYKGFYHVPRCLMRCERALKDIIPGEHHYTTATRRWAF